MPLTARKQTRDSFKQLIKESMVHLNGKRVRKCSARARAYICSYFHLAKTAEAGASGGSNTNNSTVTEKQPLLFSEIERLWKEFKVHRCALDFDRRFVNAELKFAADSQS